ncbi:DUF120 domain-containing protein [Natrarchaeobius sp. A-rgal3]|uniref:DUF120 domain-containing protein n=1 Tax=Natrarchaeobius versutus TaxID=1679078 RepID=UPI00350F3A75
MDDKIGCHERNILKELALLGAFDATIETTAVRIADANDVSEQTVSRRLRRLENAGLIDRNRRNDGQEVALTAHGRRTLAAEYESFCRIFSPDRSLELRGSVTDGLGRGGEFVSLSGYARQFEAKLGYEPFHGTLNVDLDDSDVAERYRLESIEGVAIDEWEAENRTYGAATCYPARLETAVGEYEPAHVLVPDRTDHDADQLEIIAEANLREELGLDNEGVISVHVVR